MINLKYFYRLLLLLVLAPAWLFSQDPYFKKIGIPGTNSNFRILSFCQDSRKVIWIGTSEGLYRFNGLNFEPLDLPIALTGSQVSAVAGLKSGGIVAGTRQGKLFTVINDAISMLHPDTFLINSEISSIAVSSKGETWFSTMGQGILRQSNGAFTRFNTLNGIGDDYVYDLFFDDRDCLWVGSDGGLSFSATENGVIKFRNLDAGDGLPDNIVRKISRGPGTSLGVGTEERGFCMYDYSNSNFVQHSYFENWTGGPVTGLALLSDEFWIGTPRIGIIDFEFRGKNRIRQFKSEEGLSIRDIRCMMTDHEGNIWIGAGSELYFSPGEKIEFKRMAGDLQFGSIRTILSDKKGNIWFSNESGVFCFNSTSGADDLPDQPLKGTVYNKLNVISMYEDHFGYIWMGTFDGGVLRYHPEKKSISHFDETSGLINMNVLSIAGTKSEIWFATLGGVSKCVLTDSTISGVGDFTGYSEENGLGNNFIYKVFIDSKGRAWFGTDGKGITCYSNGKFVNYNERNGLKSKVIYSITEDHSGNIWLSSVNDGIYKFDGNVFTNYTIKKGLSDLNISALATDSNGNLIVVNRKGIDVFDPGNFQVLSYGSEAGLKDIDANLNVVDVDGNGDVWIGIQQGITKISLGKKASAKLPIIVLDKVMNFLEPRDTSTGNTFEYNNNHVSFSYFSLWYLDPAKVTYQYKLEGYNSEWITTSDRLVTFPNLQPGNYTFLIRSSLNGKFELAGITSYSFVILRPFWQQSWFILIATLLLAGVFYFYLQFRDRRIKARERLNRERIESQFEVLKNQVNPHFLFNSFNTLVSIIEDDKEVAVEYVNKLSDFFRSILTYREKDLITIEEELELAESYIFLQQKRYGKNFVVTIDIPEQIRTSKCMPPLTLQILLENCLKHNSVSAETPLHCKIFLENNNYIVVQNNINPRIVHAPSTGIGLQNLRNRYKILTGVDITATEENGHFVVRLPIINKL